MHQRSQDYDYMVSYYLRHYINMFINGHILYFQSKLVFVKVTGKCGLQSSRHKLDHLFLAVYNMLIILTEQSSYLVIQSHSKHNKSTFHPNNVTLSRCDQIPSLHLRNSSIKKQSKHVVACQKFKCNSHRSTMVYTIQSS